MKNLEVKPFKNNVGALIETDLNSANSETINEIKKALNNFGVIFFRKQNLSSAKYIEIAKHFGTCADYPMLKGLENFPEITVVEKKPGEKIMFGEGWHTDSTYTKTPPKITMLYSVKTPEKGKGNTRFASQYLSYEKLENDYKDKIENLKIDNVETVKGTEKSPNLPESSVDLVIMVDVYHELAYPAEILQNIYKALKPSGKILLLEYRGEDPTINIKPLHKMTENQVKRELKANGFKFVSNGKFLPIQHFLIFEKPD